MENESIEIHKKKKNKIIKVVLLLVLFAVSFYILFRDCDFEEISGNISNMNIGFLALGFFMVFVQIFIQGLCYRAMGRSYKQKIGFLEGFGYCSSDLFFSQLTPFAVGGQPVMVYEMNKRGHPVSKTTTMVLLYSVLNKAALIILAIVAIAMYASLFFTSDTVLLVLLICGIASNLLIGGFGILCMFSGSLVYHVGARSIFWLANKKLLKNPYRKVKKLSKTIIDFQESNHFLKSHKSLFFIVLGLCLLKRIATFAVGFFVYLAFGLEGKSFVYLILIQTILAVIADSFPIPGGIGAYESSCLILYETFYPTDLVSSGVLVVRFIGYYFLIFVSGIATIILRFTSKKKEK